MHIFEVIYLHKPGGPGFIQAQWQHAAVTSFSPVPLAALFKWCSLGDVELEVVPGPADNKMAKVKDTRATYRAASWNQVGILQLHDFCGNLRRQGDLVAVFADGPGDVRIRANVTESTNGYELHVFTKIAGFYAISAYVLAPSGAKLDGTLMHLIRSPWMAEFLLPDTVSKSVASVSGAVLVAGATAGSPSYLVFATTENFGNSSKSKDMPYTRLSAAFHMTRVLPGDDGGHLSIFEVPVHIGMPAPLFQKHGHYVMSFVLYNAGVYKLRVSSDENLISAVSAKISCLPGGISTTWSALRMNVSTVGHFGLGSIFGRLVYIQSRDAFGNDINSGGESLRVHFRGETPVTGISDDQGDGTYIVRCSTLQLNAARYTMHVELARSISAGLDGGGGLTGNYFANGAISAHPTVSREDKGPLAHDWGTKEIIAGATDHVMVHWSGFLASPRTSLFKIVLKIADCEDAARVFIDGCLVAQTKAGSNSGIGEIYLLRGGLYSLSVEYRESTGPAAISLEWTNQEITKQLIPAYYLHPRGDSLQHSPFSLSVAEHT